MLAMVTKGFVQTGPRRFTDAALAVKLGLKPYKVPSAPVKAAKPATAKAAPVSRTPSPPAPASRPAAPASAAPASMALPPSPKSYMHPRFMGPHEQRAATAELKKWLRVADVVRAYAPLTPSQAHEVDLAEARLAELAQFGTW